MTAFAVPLAATAMVHVVDEQRLPVRPPARAYTFGAAARLLEVVCRWEHGVRAGSIALFPLYLGGGRDYPYRGGLAVASHGQQAVAQCGVDCLGMGRR